MSEANPPTLCRVFGDSAVAKILDFLTLYREFDYPKTEISRNSEVAWKTLYRVWPILKKYELVKPTRRIGRAEMFKLNTDNPIARAIGALAYEIAKFDVDKIVKEEAAKAEMPPISIES